VSRIIAGSAGGRRLTMPEGCTTRPTAERVREALASALEPLQDRSVLDLCAGSGAVGLELASRGASRVTLVDDDPLAVAVARANASALGLRGVAVHQATVEAFLARTPDPVDVVFLDPPYDLPVDGLLIGLRPWLAPGAVVVVERDRRSPEPAWPEGVEVWRSKKYGDTVLWWALLALTS
jgi:16S rRNA (guanine966-N2)-methyltransferase